MAGLPSRRRWVKAVRYFAYAVAALAAVLVVAALYLPGLLDTPAVKAQIERELSAAVHGEVAWESLSLRILPRPHGTLHKVRVERPGLGSASAEAAEVHLRLWPLFRGRAEIASVTIVKPVVQIHFEPEARGERTTQKKKPGGDVVERYRTAIGAIVGGIGRFAPDTAFATDDGVVDLAIPGAPPMQLRQFSLRARTTSRGIELDATSAGNHWSRLTLSVRLDLADFSGTARVDLAGIKPAAWLERYLDGSPVAIAVPEASLRAQARTDGKTGFEFDVDLRAESVAVARGGQRAEISGAEVKAKIAAGAREIAIQLDEARLGASRFAGGGLRYALKDRSLAGDVGYDLDLAQGLDYTRRLAANEAGAALHSIESVAGRAQGRVKLALARGAWSVGVDVAKSDSALRIRDLPGPVRLAGGTVEIDRNAVKVTRAAVSMPAGEVRVSALRYSFGNGAIAGDAEFDLDLSNSMELARRALPEADRDALSVIQSAAGRVRGTAKLAYTQKDWNAGVEIVKSDAQVQVRDIPGPVGLSAGSARITPAAVSIERAALTLLDAVATASVTIGDFREGPSVRGSVAEGTIGEKFLDWVWQLAEAPPHLMLKSPVRIAAPSFAWGPKRALDVQGTARFDAGPSVAIAFGWTPAALDVRRAAIKDERSDAVVGARIAGSALEGRFSGALNSASIEAVLASAKVPAGTLAGDLRFAFDRDNPRHASAEGSLTVEALDLAWLVGRPVTIERLDLAADGANLRIRDATVNWAGQRATKRGEIRRSASGLVIDAQLDSPGIILDRLLEPRAAVTGAKPAAKGEQPKPRAVAIEKPLPIWPLPVTGRIEMRSGFLRSGRHHLASVAATLELEERRARLDLKSAELCGISLPLTLEATPQGYSASARITAQKQQLEQTANCLSEASVLITGTYDLKADIRTQGQPADFLQNLKGEVRAEVRDGRILKFALLGNILSMRNVASTMKEGGPKLDKEGFPYRELIVSGNLAEGRFNLTEGAFRSDALGLAADGWISLTDYNTRLTVLVAPFSRVDELVRNVPLVGYIIGGTFTSVPVGVSGDIRDPLVVPLGPHAVTSHLLGIFERTLKLPAKLIAPAE